MSEEKLYAIKNDDGEWADTHYVFGSIAWVTPDKNMCEEEAKHNGGHVVTLIEEPKKVVLTKEQAVIVEAARDFNYPANYISGHTFSSDDEKSLMNAYVNGYTVAKEKKYRLPVPKSWCGDNDHYWHKESDGTLTWSILSGRSEDFEFSKNEIGKFGLQDCEKEELTDDEV